MRRVRVVGVGFAVLLGIGASACSDDDELSFEDWQEQASAVCEEYEARIDELEEDVDVGETREELAAYLDLALPLNQEYTDAIIDVGIPSEQAEAVDRLHEDLLTQADLAQDFRQAVEDGDQEAAGAIAIEMEAESDALNAMAPELGVPECDSRDDTEEDESAKDPDPIVDDEPEVATGPGPFVGSFYNTDDDGSTQEIAITANQAQADGSYSYELS